MVRRAFSLARLHVHFNSFARPCEWRRCENVVDAPAEISLESIAVVIPIGVLDSGWVQHPKNIHEAPVEGAFIHVSSIDVEIHVVYALFWMVNIDWLRSHIHVTHPQRRLLRIKVLVEECLQAL